MIARTGVLSALDPAPRSVRETVELLVSELVTNAVEHAGIGEPESVEVKVSRIGSRAVRIEVADTGAGFDRLDAEEVGFGLSAVDRLASRWGVERRPAGTTVWFELGA